MAARCGAENSSTASSSPSLIAFTSPIAEDDILVAPTVLTSTHVPGDILAMHTN